MTFAVCVGLLCLMGAQFFSLGAQREEAGFRRNNARRKFSQKTGMPHYPGKAHLVAAPVFVPTPAQYAAMNRTVDRRAGGHGTRFLQSSKRV